MEPIAKCDGEVAVMSLVRVWRAVHQFSRICNSAAMSWGFAIPPSSVLFVDLSNRITNSYIHGRRITNSPEQVNWIANPNTQFCRITNCFTLRPATVGSPEREKPPENATNATIMPPREPP